MVQRSRPRGLQVTYVCTVWGFFPAVAVGSRRVERLLEESSSGARAAQLRHLAGALLQNRLFFHFPLLCSQLKVTGTNVPSEHSVDAHPAHLFFFFLIWLFYCSVSPWFLRSVTLFSLLRPSKVNTSGDMLPLSLRPFLIFRELTEVPL